MRSKIRKLAWGLSLVGLIALYAQAADEAALSLFGFEPWVKFGVDAAEVSSKLESTGIYTIDETTRYIAFRSTEMVELLGKKWNQAYTLYPKESGLSRVNYDRKSGPESAMDDWTGDEEGAQIDKRYIDQCEDEFKTYLTMLTSTLNMKPSEQNYYGDSLEYSWTLANGTKIVADHSCTTGPLLQTVSIELPKSSGTPNPE